VARSNEAKRLGLKMGEAYFKRRDFLQENGVEVWSSNYPLYADMSARVMRTLHDFAPELEIYSIDEAFMSLPGFEEAALKAHCREMRATVKRWTGIPVSIGVGSTKTLAKVANERAKKDPWFEGVLDMSGWDERELDKLLDATDVEDVWGIGPQRAALLRHYGYYTAADLKYAPDRWLLEKLTVMGLRTAMELRGTPCIPLELAPPAKKAIASTRSFGKVVESLEELKEAVSLYVARLGEKLRRQWSVAGVLQVFVRTNPFKPEEPQYAGSASIKLPQATSYTPHLARYAHAALEQLYRPGYRYHKAGVLALNLSQQALQLNLFGESGPAELAREADLMAAVDALNRRYGREMVRLASSGVAREWKMRQGRVSPRYTTRWEDLPGVHLG
jgi:DNA polymerase V